MALYLQEVLLNEVDIDKYKVLFEYMKGEYSDESDRYRRLEDKAIKYLTSITVDVSAFVILLRWSLAELIPNDGCLSKLTIIASIITLISLSYSWYFLFLSLRLQTLYKMPIGNDIVDMFKKNKLDAVYLALSKRYSEGAEKRYEEYTHKLKNVQNGYRGVLFSAGSFIIFVALVIVQTWSTV